MIPQLHPHLLLAGYSIIGLPTDNLLPIVGVFGGSFFLFVVAGLISCLIYQLTKKHPKRILSIVSSLLVALALPFLAKCWQWTIPYDQRAFGYIMQTRLDSEHIPHILESQVQHIPKLMVLGAIYKKNSVDGTWPEHIYALDQNPH